MKTFRQLDLDSKESEADKKIKPRDQALFFYLISRMRHLNINQVTKDYFCIQELNENTKN